MLKAIVFDFDGVIVDSEPLHYRAFLEVAERELGVRFSYEDYLRSYIGYDDRDAFRVMMGLRAGTPGGAADEARVERLREAKGDAFEAIVRGGVEPIPGVAELVAAAAAEMPIAIASGATTRDIELILGGTALRQRFQTIVSADQVERSKPDPQSYALAVEALARRNPALKLQPVDCLSIEDTAAGIESARGAGLMTLGVTTTGPAEKLARAHRVVETLRGISVSQLKAWFE